MPPYEAVYGHVPPTLLDYTAGASSIAAVDNLLVDRTTILKTLKENIAQAQNRIRNNANL